MQAAYKVSLTTSSAYTALSTAGEESATDAGPGLTKHTFELTPVIPPHYLSLYVGEFATVEGVYARPDGSSVAVRVHVRPAKVDFVELALDTTIVALRGAPPSLHWPCMTHPAALFVR